MTICNYEAAANPADHKVESIIPQTNFISWKPRKVGRKRRRRRGFSGVCLTGVIKSKMGLTLLRTGRLVELDWDWAQEIWRPESFRGVWKCQGVALLSMAIKSEVLLWAKRLETNAWNIWNSEKVCCFQFNLYTLNSCLLSTTSIKWQLLWNKMLKAGNKPSDGTIF